MGGANSPGGWRGIVERSEEDIEFKNAKNYVKGSINDANKKGLNGLDALLTVISDLSKSILSIYAGEEYIREEMKNLNYKLKDVEDVAKDKSLYNCINKPGALGVSISAAINNVIKPGEKIYIDSPKPIDNLFYNLKDAEGHVNVAGDYLGKNAINSTIYAKKTGNNAGNGAYHSMLYIDKAGNMFAYSAKRSEIHFGEVGDGAAKYMSGCNVYGRKAGKDFGENAFKSNMYVDELGNNPGLGMQYSELHFKKLDGKLGSWDVDVKANNKVYKNGLPYILPNIKHAAKVMTYWTKGGISNLGGSIINNSRSILGVAQITVGALAIEEGVPYVYLRMPGYLYALPFVALLGGYSFYRGIYNVLKDN